ncbi:hypothetical protein OH76DRAFT_87861 [Lentinus brumalis]|uniref:Uncharacterized protein n=1 Tax=Lentinus brumalis TaxID=2498619 RepID=A0A371CQY1_9APHY|nr:hypothetical protein OH76DRAFT_87861 [Polyporus brumalis]
MSYQAHVHTSCLQSYGSASISAGISGNAVGGRQGSRHLSVVLSHEGRCLACAALSQILPRPPCADFLPLCRGSPDLLAYTMQSKFKTGRDDDRLSLPLRPGSAIDRVGWSSPAVLPARRLQLFRCPLAFLSTSQPSNAATSLCVRQPSAHSDFSFLVCVARCDHDDRRHRRLETDRVDDHRAGPGVMPSLTRSS